MFRCFFHFVEPHVFADVSLVTNIVLFLLSVSLSIIFVVKHSEVNFFSYQISNNRDAMTEIQTAPNVLEDLLPESCIDWKTQKNSQELNNYYDQCMLNKLPRIYYEQVNANSMWPGKAINLEYSLFVIFFINAMMHLTWYVCVCVQLCRHV